MGSSRSGSGRVLQDFAPFAGAGWLAWTVVLFTSSVNGWQYVLSVVLGLASAAMTLSALLGRLRGRVAVVPAALVFLLAAGLLRNATGGMTSGTGALALIPAFQTALYSRSRRELCLVLVGVAAFYLLPIVIVGAPAYPASQYRSALLSVTVSSLIGVATQRLMASVRFQAREARSHEKMLEQVKAVVYGLLESPQVRDDVCESAKRISQAELALLYEPGPEDGRLRCTAINGFDADTSNVTAKPGSAVADAFSSGRARLITEDVEAHVGNVEMWIAAGRPASILYQPLIRDASVLGVLVVGWPGSVRAEGPRASVVALLAHEAAAAVARADRLDLLARDAQTDALTGLPNRRAWDAHLVRAAAELEHWAVAILDLDHFKRFNDTYGHPAGDRLLKETAAAWRDQLRAGDVLARFGGEEFALLLPHCDAPTAESVVNRLRTHVTHGRTCSAGIAVRERDESADAAVARADYALYEAKAQGRDRSHLSEVRETARPTSETLADQ